MSKVRTHKGVFFSTPPLRDIIGRASIMLWTVSHSSGVAFLKSQLRITPHEEFNLRCGATTTGTSRKLVAFRSASESSAFSTSTTIDLPSFCTDLTCCFVVSERDLDILKGEYSLKETVSFFGVIMINLENLGIFQILSMSFSLIAMSIKFCIFDVFFPWWLDGVLGLAGALEEEGRDGGGPGAFE